jgi:phosphatidate cytidylyltransferase
MLKQRILTSIVGIPILILCVWFGSPWLTLGIGLLSVIASLEFYKIANHLNIKPLKWLGIISILLIIFSNYIPIASPKLFILVVSTIISLIWILFIKPKDKAFNNWAWTMGGILYIGLMFSYWDDLRNLDVGMSWLFWAIFIIVACDSGAYFIGKGFGKRKMTPGISPHKTWGGAIGGLLVSIIVSVGLGMMFNFAPLQSLGLSPLPISYWVMAIMGFLISVIAQLGDLIESLLKRNADIKDSGNFFPGHGGVLDRIDSYLLVGVFTYYFVLYFVRP